MDQPDFASAAADVTAAAPPRVDAPINDTANMFHDAAESVMQDSRASLRSNMIEAKKIAPDAYAKDKQAGDAVGIPTPLVNDQVKDMATAKAADELQATSPKLASHFQLPDFAHLAQDDIPQLSAIEQATNPPTKPVVDSLMNAPYAGLQTVLAPFNKAIETFGVAASTVPMLWDKVSGSTAATEWWYKHAVDPYVQNESAFELDKNAGLSEKAVGAVGSAIGMLVQAMATGGTAEAVPVTASVAQGVKAMVEHGASSMMIPAISEAMTTARKVYETTGDINAAIRAGQMSYFTTLAGGVIPLGAGGSLAKRMLVTGPVSGLTTGEGSRVLMNSALPPNMQQPFDPESFALQGVIGGVLSFGGGHGGSDAKFYDFARKTYTDAAKAENAENTMKVLQAVSQAAGESNLRERAPDVFHEFVDAVSDGSKVKDLFVNGETLVKTLDQAGVSREELAQTMPEVEAQINEALHTQGDVRISLADYATHIAGTKVDPLLIEHLKDQKGVDGLTFAEYKEQKTFEQEQMLRQVQEVMSEHKNDSEWRQSAANVETELRSQLESTNRFTSDVSGVQAKIISQMYMQLAHRLSTADRPVTPEQAYQQYPLDVHSAAGAGNVLDQKPPTIASRLKAVWNAATGSGGNNSNTLDQPVSTRYPFGKTTTENPIAQTLLANLTAMRADPKVFANNTELTTKYVNFPPGVGKAPEERAQAFVNHMVENLLWLHNQVPEATRERSKLWYVGANRIAKLFANEHGATEAQAAGIIASLSPQKDWFMNASLAERVIHILASKQEHVWDSKMTATADRIFDKPQYAEALAAVKGRALQDLTSNYERAMWIRVYDETHNTRNYRSVTPEGHFGDWVKNADGQSSKVAWSTVGSIEKAVSIAYDHGVGNISNQLGREHKVRSFYNNIFDPNDRNGHVTIDTHAVAAALLRPLSGAAREVMHNFGNEGASSSRMSGLSGTYALYAEAYQRAAAQVGILPREMQSITWEAVRGLFEKGNKTDAHRAEIDALWKDFHQGKATIDETRNAILTRAGGITAPSWESGGGKVEGTRTSSYRSELPEAGVPEGRASATVSGGNGADADSTGAAAAVAGRSEQRVLQQPDFRAGDGERSAGISEAQRSASVAAGAVPSLVGLPDRPMQIGEQWYVPGPFEKAHAIAAAYMKAAGLPYTPIQTFRRVNVELGTRIAAAFDAMQNNPNDPLVRASYDAMIKETLAQWAAIKESGLQVEFIKPGQTDPYAVSPRQAIEDVVRNNHLWVYPTSTGYGPNLINIGLNVNGGGHIDPAAALAVLKNAGVLMHAVHPSNTEPTLVAQLQRPLTPDEAHLISVALKQESIAQLTGGVGELHGPKAEAWRPFNPDYFLTLNGKTATEEGLTTSNNPMLQRVGENIGGHEMVANDVLRIVHDYFGHIKDGVGFRADGEDNAWRSHASMYSDLARRAMTTETRGNNSWVNFGPHGETNRMASAADTQYAPQKIGLLPEWASEEGMRDPPAYEQNARGQISFGDRISEGATISLLKGADRSTLFHELGHFYLEVLSDIASKPDAPAAITSDMQTALTFMGVKDHATWRDMSHEERRQYHEKFAKAFESYLFEGKSPSMEMSNIFARVRQWMIGVYQHLVDIGAPLDDEIRGVFDRMIASDDQIKQAETARGMFAMFKTKPEGMTDQAWSDYINGNQEATENAVNEVQRKSIADMQWLSNAKSEAMRKLQKKADAERKGIREEVAAEVDQQDVYRAELWLRKGETIAPNGDVVKAEKGFKLDAEKVAELYPETMLARPDIGRLEGMTSKKGGQDPQIVAEMFGYKDGDALIRALIDMQPKDDVIQGMTDQRMLERHGEMADPVAIERAAEAAIHNPVRARMIATELKAVSKALLPAKALVKGATEAAEAAIGQRKVKDVNPQQHEAAEARSAKSVEAALKKADTQAVIAAKRAQLLNNRLAKAAMDAVEDVKNGLTYLAKFSKPTVRENIDVQFRDQIDALLGRFDLRKSLTPEQAADKRTDSLEKFVEKLSAMKFNLEIPEALLNEANRQHYKDMTVDAFRGLLDSVKSIEHLGRSMQKVQDGAETRLLADAALEAQTQTAGMPQRKSETNRGLSTIAEKWLNLKSSARSGAVSLLKMEQICDWLDNRNSNGIFNRLVFRKIADAEGKRNDLQLKIAKQWQDAIAAIPKDLFTDARRNGIVEIPGAIDALTGKNQRLTWNQKMMLAMIRGDASHFAKLLKGEKWDANAVLDFLDKNVSGEEWNFIHAISKTFAELEPLKHAMLRDIGSTAPKSVAKIPFQTPHGEYPGWYVPISYDPARAHDVEMRNARSLDTLFTDNIYTRADTSTGREITRSENYARPMLLSLDTLPRVLKDEIRDITTHQAIMEADRFIRHPMVRAVVSNTLSKEHYNLFNGWLLSLANDAAARPSELQWWDNLAHGLRTRTTMVGLGLRLSTMIQHALTAGGESVAEAGPKAMLKGTFNTKTLAAWSALGPEWMTKGIESVVRNDQFVANRDFIFDRSAEMRHRNSEFERDVREQLRDIQLKLADPATGWLKRGVLQIQARAYSGIGMLDMASAIPTWMGAYLKGMERIERGGLGFNEQDAVYFADKTVRNAHGGGGVKDMAAVQRGTESFKLLTMFYTFWSHNVNRIIDTAKLAGTLPATAASGDLGKFTGDLGTVVLRSFMYTLGVQAIHHMMHPPKEGDDVDSWAVFLAKQMGLAAFSGIPIARDIAGHFFAGKDYNVSPIKALVDSGDAILKDVEGKSHTEQYIKHAMTAAGYVTGMPLGQVGNTVQFLSDYWNGKQNPQDIAEWWHGISSGKSR